MVKKNRNRSLWPKLYLGILFISSSYVLSEFWSFVLSPVYRDLVGDIRVERDLERAIFPRTLPPVSRSEGDYSGIYGDTEALRNLPQVKIPINKESSYVSSDVLKIVHAPAKSRIEIHLQANSTRRCQHPIFKYRISGWSLSMIDFETREDQEYGKADVVVGTYDLSQMPISGKYYVEIIMLLCGRYNQDLLGVNLKSICMENTTNANHRITAGDGESWINVTLDPVSNQQASPGGRWLHKDFVANQRRRREPQMNHHRNNTPAKMLTTKPLYTRYQPKECMQSEKDFKTSKETDFCRAVVNRERFDAYTFRWNHGPDVILNKPFLGISLTRDGEVIGAKSNESFTQNKYTHVCFVGGSHSRILNNKCQSLLERTRKEKDKNRGSVLETSNLECSHVKVQFPVQILNGCASGADLKQCASLSVSGISSLPEDWVLSNVGKPGCTHAVVGLFQWPFSFYQPQPNWTFSDWKTQMSDVTRVLERAARRSDIPLRKIVLRSAHPNGLKWHLSACPPIDLRSPPNADVATRILREIAEEHSDESNSTQIVSFLDTGFVTSPVWDSPEDWSHYSLEEGSVEVKFIISEILKKD